MPRWGIYLHEWMSEKQSQIPELHTPLGTVLNWFAIPRPPMETSCVTSSRTASRNVLPTRWWRMHTFAALRQYNALQTADLVLPWQTTLLPTTTAHRHVLSLCQGETVTLIDVTRLHWQPLNDLGARSPAIQQSPGFSKQRTSDWQQAVAVLPPSTKRTRSLPRETAIAWIIGAWRVNYWSERDEQGGDRMGEYVERILDNMDCTTQQACTT